MYFLVVLLIAQGSRADSDASLWKADALLGQAEERHVDPDQAVRFANEALDTLQPHLEHLRQRGLIHTARGPSYQLADLARRYLRVIALGLPEPSRKSLVSLSEGRMILAQRWRNSKAPASWRGLDVIYTCELARPWQPMTR